MNNIDTQSNQKSPQPEQRGSNRWVWLVLLVAIGVMQWSAIEDLYYEVTGTEFPESKIAWRHDFAAASTEAAESNKPMLVVFGASWCPPCREMKRRVWPDAKVTEAADSLYIPLYIDVDDAKHQSLSVRYDVQSIPAVLVMDAAGNLIDRRNYMSRREAFQFLSEAAAK